jgi:predicted transcriptional regulator
MDLHEIDEHMQGLTPHQLKIVQAVYDGGGNWLTRSKVAKSLGKRRLTPYDINCLKMLAEKGVIIESTQPTDAPGSDFAYVYHMTDDVAETLQQWSEIRDQEAKERQRKPINLVTE